MNQNQCNHPSHLIYQMYWPDGGTAEFCSGCFHTRHNDIYTTEWQNHGYKCLGDWYREAAKVADGINEYVFFLSYNRKNPKWFAAPKNRGRSKRNRRNNQR